VTVLCIDSLLVLPMFVSSCCLFVELCSVFLKGFVSLVPVVVCVFQGV